MNDIHFFSIGRYTHTIFAAITVSSISSGLITDRSSLTVLIIYNFYLHPLPVMATKMNLSNVMNIMMNDDDSDWDESEDELVAADGEGVVDGYMESIMSPLDKLEASFENETDDVPVDEPASSLMHEEEPGLVIPLEDEPDTDLEMQPLATSSPEPQPPTSRLSNYFVHPLFTQKVGSLLFLTEDDDPVDFFETIYLWVR